MRCGEWIRINANLKISLLAAGASFCSRAWRVSVTAPPCHTPPPSPANSPRRGIYLHSLPHLIGIENLRKIAAPGTSAGGSHFA